MKMFTKLKWVLLGGVLIFSAAAYAQLPVLRGSATYTYANGFRELKDTTNYWFSNGRYNKAYSAVMMNNGMLKVLASDTLLFDSLETQDATGRITKREIRTYDNQNRIIGKQVFDGFRWTTYRYAYDRYGNVILIDDGYDRYTYYYSYLNSPLEGQGHYQMSGGVFRLVDSINYTRNGAGTVTASVTYGLGSGGGLMATGRSFTQNQNEYITQSYSVAAVNWVNSSKEVRDINNPDSVETFRWSTASNAWQQTGSYLRSVINNSIVIERLFSVNVPALAMYRQSKTIYKDRSKGTILYSELGNPVIYLTQDNTYSQDYLTRQWIVNSNGSQPVERKVNYSYSGNFQLDSIWETRASQQGFSHSKYSRLAYVHSNGQVTNEDLQYYNSSTFQYEYGAAGYEKIYYYAMVYPPVYQNIIASTCSTYTSPTGRILSANGVYRDTIVTPNAADSIFTINLTVVPKTVNVSRIVQFNSYTWAADGNTYTVSGSYASVSGCTIDSLYLTILLTPNVPLNFNWVKRFGADGFEAGLASATDAWGNHYVAGNFQTSLQLGATKVFVADSANFLDRDIFLTKLSTNGVVQWGTKLGGSGKDDVKEMQVDGNGNLYVVGTYLGTFRVGNQSVRSMGAKDIFLVKYDSSGALQYLKSFGGAGNDEVKGLAIQGNSFAITGWFNGTSTFGAFTLNNASATGNGDVFLAKGSINSGNISWALSVAGDGHDCSNDVSFDNNGNLLMTGFFMNNGRGNGPWGLRSSGIYDAFLVSYNAFGGLNWVNSLRGNGDEMPSSIAVRNNQVFIAGYFTGNIGPSANVLTLTAGSWDWFVAKYSTAGTFQSIRTGGGADQEYPTSVAVTSEGNVAVAGTIGQGATVFGMPVSYNSTFGGLLMILDSTLTPKEYVIPRPFRAGSTSYINAISTADSGVVNITGSFLGYTDFSGNPLLSWVDNDVLVGKVSNLRSASQVMPRINPIVVISDKTVLAPIDWIQFELKGNELNWKVASIFDHATYVVQTSMNGFEWNDAQVIKASVAGTLEKVQLVAQGTFVRVVMKGENGIFNCSDVLTCSTKSAITETVQLNLYPNPASEQCMISLNGGLMNQVVIRTLEGKVLSIHEFKGVQTFELNVDALATGIYFVEVKDSFGSVHIKKLTVTQ